MASTAPMYVRPCCQCDAILFRMSAVSTACGRQSAAPTQNVERQVAINSTSGKARRRRGKCRCDSRNSGNCDQSRVGGPLRDRRSDVITGLVIFTLSASGNLSTGGGSDGVGVLIV